MLTVHDCKTALDDLRRRFSNADGEAMLAKFGVKKPADLPDELRSMFVAACEGGPNSAIVAGLGAKTKTTAANDGAADPLESFQRQGARNDEAVREYWNDRKAARDAGEPEPSLPSDEHNARVAEKMSADREAAKNLGTEFWKK